jgi:uncharacterized protein (DUF4415 family)
MKKKILTNKVGTVRELTGKDIRAMRPAKEVLSKQLLNALAKRKRGERGPQKEPKKISITIRYSPEVVQYFKKTGEGWQVRIDKILKNYVKKKSSKHAA